MKVLFPLLSFAVNAPAGIERSVNNLCVGLVEAGHDPLVLTAHPAPGTDLATVIDIGLGKTTTEVELIETLENPYVRELLRSSIAATSADIVCWTDASWGLGYLASELVSERSLCMMHVPRFDPLAYRMVESSEAVLVPSRFVADAITLWSNQTVVLPNAVEQSLPNAAPGRSSVPNAPIRAMSRAAPGKGIPELVSAFPRGEMRSFEVALGSAGFELDSGTQQVQHASLDASMASDERVERVPAVPWAHTGDFWLGAALALNPSMLDETFGMCAVEASAAACPVVAFDVGAHREVLGDGALLVGLDAGVAGIWSAAQSLLANEDRYVQLSERALERSRQYSPGVVADHFISIVRNVLD